MIDHFLSIQPKQGEEGDLTQVLVNFARLEESETEIDDYTVTIELRLKDHDSIAKVEKLALEKTQTIAVEIANYCKKISSSHKSK